MEYSRKVSIGGGIENVGASTDFRVMDFGSVFLPPQSKGQGADVTSVQSTTGGQPAGYNVAEMLLSRGLAKVVQHRDFEERSNYYDALLAAESKPKASRKGVHADSSANTPAYHIQDLTNVSLYYMIIMLVTSI
jgi:staphylococcal nuclease domain-containing protein 1